MAIMNLTMKPTGKHLTRRWRQTGMRSDISVEVMQDEEEKQIAQIIQDQMCDNEWSDVNVKCTDDIYKIVKSKVDVDQQFKITTQ